MPFRTKMRVEHALKERNVRVACSIVETIRHALDLIDEQSPPVVEAIMDYGRGTRASHETAARMAMRGALRMYCENALVEARKRERREFHGIPDMHLEHEPDGDDTG